MRGAALAPCRLNARGSPAAWAPLPASYARCVGRAQRRLSSSSTSHLVTTPVYYVNSVPHIGHLYSSLVADSIARYRRLAEPGARVLLATGTDEHGLKVQGAARDRGVSPRALCDEVSASFRSMHAAFDVSNDDFVRTSEARHARVVRWLWRRLVRRGHVYLGSHEGWYCRSDEAFLTDTQVVRRSEFERRQRAAAATAAESDPTAPRGEPAAPMVFSASLLPSLLAAVAPDAAAAGDAMVSAESGHAVEWLSEENYMFRLSAAQPALLQWLDTVPPPVAPPSRLAEVRSFLRAAPLTDLSVSRRSDKVSWAIPVPGDGAHSVYVWIDALSSYLTMARGTGHSVDVGRRDDAAPVSAAVAATGDHLPGGGAIAPSPLRDDDAGGGDGELPDDVPWQSLFPAWPADVHVIGKDILRFHAVYWPALLLAAGMPPPRRILAHGHWTVGQVKMSKSLGNVVAPASLVTPAGPHSVDAVRYALLKEGGIGADGDFGPNVLHRAAVSDCADTLGNLASRVVNAALMPAGTLPAALAGGPRQWHAQGLMTDDELALAGRCGGGNDGVAGVAAAAYAAGHPGVALAAIMAAVAECNRLFAAAEPWVLARRCNSARGGGDAPGAAFASSSQLPDSSGDLRQDGAAAGDACRLAVVLYLALEVLRVASILLQPAMPTAAPLLLRRLGLRAGSPAREWSAAYFGHREPADVVLDTAGGPFILFAKQFAPEVGRVGAGASVQAGAPPRTRSRMRLK